ncbi:MAG: TetR/AcrR family transcriptional regulator [Chloroflexi bacterium]|nr:MAG: TetR/AcrR family transcriptional regulator [Chloroflexota bacterium]
MGARTRDAFPLSAQRAVNGREDEILAAAARIFREKGYHGASIRDIADSVGLLKGSLYHYIRSKEELLARLFDGALEGTVRELETIAAREATPSDRLREMVKTYVRAVTANLDAVGLYLREWRALPAPELARLRARRRAMRALPRHVQLALRVVPPARPTAARGARR